MSKSSWALLNRPPTNVRVKSRSWQGHLWQQGCASMWARCDNYYMRQQVVARDSHAPLRIYLTTITFVHLSAKPISCWDWSLLSGIAMYLRLQTIVNVSQKSHSEHPPFARWASLPLSTIEIDLSKKIAGRAWLVWISDFLVNIAFLDLVFYLYFHTTFPFRMGFWKAIHLRAPRFALSTRLIWNQRENFKKPDLLKPVSPLNRVKSGKIGHFQTFKVWTFVPAIFWFMIVCMVKMWSDRKMK